MAITKEIEKIKKKQAEHRYWRFKNKEHIKRYEAHRYTKRKPYILKLNEKAICKSGSKVVKGYLYICCPNHPHATKQGFIAHHRLIIEAKIGRFLYKHEVVHHIDENKLNNSIHNLELLDDQAAHALVHSKIADRNIKGQFVSVGVVHSNGD